MSTNKRELSQEQQKVFDQIVSQKKNIFFTGCAGTGKSFLLKHIIEYFRATFDSPDSLSVTASTGRAAFNIGGSTLHSFVGLGLAKGDPKELINKATFNRKLVNRWKSLRVLIIDEVSMLDASYFDLLEQLARAVRKSNTPFGGVQLILTGDLLQLPPVNEGYDRKKRIFQSKCWPQCINVCTVLSEVFRQDDIEFIKFLTCIRVGAVTKEVVEFAEKLAEPKTYDSDTGPVNLYSTRSRTDYHNSKELNSINEELREYQAIDHHKSSYRSSNSNPLDNCPAPPTVQLKAGAQVMLVRNINKNLVNGSVGVVTGFSTLSTKAATNTLGALSESLPIVRFDFADGRVLTRLVTREVWSQQLPSGEEIASRKQVPLILAWAVTIHKSQGQTIQKLRVDLSDIFESGQVYTALSRAVGPKSLEVIGFDPTRITVDNESLQFCLHNDLI